MLEAGCLCSPEAAIAHVSCFYGYYIMSPALPAPPSRSWPSARGTSRRRRALIPWLASTLIFAFLNAMPDLACAYALEGASWPAGTTVVLQLGLGNAGRTLIDGNTSWNTAAAPAFNTWDQKIQRAQLTSATPIGSVSSGDGVNAAIFSNSVFGQSFGNGTLAVTYYIIQGSRMVEADILFNRGQNFDSYRGPLRFGSNGFVIADIRRVMVHELGHVLGLAHPDNHGQHVDAIMNSITSDRETLSSDDIAGGQSLYGAPGPTPTPTPTPSPSPGSSHLANISTRVNVGVNDDVLIGGFIVRGSVPKRMILRAIGPSLADAGVSGALADPILELHNSTGAVIAANDDWQSSAQATEIAASGLAPRNPFESAIVAALQPGTYTAIVRGVNNTTGIALVEGYELDSTAARLVNISTRGQVGVGDQVLIGGLIVTGSQPKNVVLRAIGPSLTGAGVHGAVTDPMIELHNASGVTIATNDNWQSSAQASAINATGLAPRNPLESAILVTISPGNYTAIVRGVNNTTGIGLVEVYDLDPVE
jgi:Matrixin